MASLAVGRATWAQAPAEPLPPAAGEPMPPPGAAEPPPPAPPPVYAPVTPMIAAPVAPAAAPAPAMPSAPPLKIETPVGSFRIGMLMQAQYQAAQQAGSLTVAQTSLPTGYAQNIYLRRMRLMMGASLFGSVELFVLTDFPNLLLAGPPAAVAMGAPAATISPKNTPGMNIQDAFGTYKAPLGDMLKIDVGYMLPPMSHNSLQSAVSMLGWDYYAYTFQHASVFGGATVGRDVGAQVRGLLLGGHIDYRVGIFQGLREAPTATEVLSRNFFRVTARLQINLLDTEPGFFYGGTYFGTKKIFSIGGAYDFQRDYKYYDADAFVDLPAGPGVATAQVSYAHWDGGGFVPIATQSAIMGEAGYTVLDLLFSPVVRYERLSGAGIPNTQTRYAGGLAYWHKGHNSNLKLFYTRIQTENTPRGANQFNLQWQVAFY